ncbi:MAG TPA: hypothetical protein VM694_31250, partial [Polyangium sp.]|nr:hypothetical protein [Polyangium sp.]
MVPCPRRPGLARSSVTAAVLAAACVTLGLPVACTPTEPRTGQWQPTDGTFDPTRPEGTTKATSEPTT